MSSERWDQTVAANIAMANSALGRDMPAGRRAADLENILHLIVAQLADTDRRHTETMQHMQDRLDLIGAEASAIRSRVPHTSQPTMDRISESIAQLAASLERGNPRPAEDTHYAPPASEADDRAYGYGFPCNHHESAGAGARSHDAPDPWDRQSAEALAAAYDGIGAAPQTRSAPSATRPQAQQANPPSVEIRCTSDIDRSWIDARLDEVAGRLEQSLADMRPDNAFLAIGQRFDQFEDRFGDLMESVATRSDVESLRLVEAHLNEVQGNLHHLGTQLSRLDAIEAQLRTLAERMDVSSSEHESTSGAHDIEAVASTAADRVVQRLASADGADVLSRHIEPMRILLEDISRERRQGEANTTAILDTLQQAMLRVLDRVDAMEAPQLQSGPTVIAEMPPAAAPAPAALDYELYDLTRYGNPLTAPAGDELVDTADEETPARFGEPAASAAAPATAARPSVDKLRRDLLADLLRAKERADLEEANDDTPVHQDEEEPEVRESGAGLRPKTRGARFGSTLARVLLGLLMLGAASAGAALVVSRQAAVAADPAREAFRKTAGALPRENSSDVAQAGAAAVPPPGVALHDSGELDSGQYRRIANRLKMARISDGLGMAAARPTPVSLTPADRLAPTLVDRSNATVSLTGATGANRLDMPPATVGPLSLRLAAAKGDPSAEFEVATRLAGGRGTDQNLKEALRWYQKAATQGFAQAQYRLGTLYERGLGTKLDLARASVWYKRAAEQGSIKAMHNLAVLSASQSTAPDYRTAAKWFKVAAEHGLSESQFNLAVLYEGGLGVERDLTEAYKWLAIAARSGDEQAIDRRDHLKAAIDPEAVAAADATIESWRAKPADPLVNDARAAGEAWKTRLHSDDNS